MEDLVRSQLAHLLPEASDRIAIGGAPLSLGPEAAQYLALALHEHSTNAAKHGALGHPDGTVRIGWRVRQLARGPRAELSWIEAGKALEAPTHSGFGRLLLEQLVPRALNGAAAMDFGPSGLGWRISFEL